MNRQPQYSIDRNKRVISLPNGFWIAQNFAGGAGQKRGTVNGRPQDHRDPWENLAPPTDDRQQAIQRIGTLAP